MLSVPYRSSRSDSTDFYSEKETILQILLPKHLADLTPQVILYPICRRKKL